MIYVAALAKNRVIGNAGKLPWHLPGELKWFKSLTIGHIVLMGRGTWDGGMPKPLRDRDNWVVTRRPIEGVQPQKIFATIEDAHAAALAVEDRKVFVIGGATLFDQCRPWVKEMYLTHVDLEPEGDTFFPEFDLSAWKSTTLNTVEDAIPYRTVHYLLDQNVPV